MKIIRAKDYKEMSQRAADLLFAQAVLKRNAVLGLATGSTVLGIYESLIERHKKGDVDFSEINTVNLDEYVNLPVTDPNSYRYYMDNNFFNHININRLNTHLPNGLAENPEEACREYDRLIERLGGIDIQLLGLGLNGHIGFNEPDEGFVPHTQCVALEESTIKANARFFKSIEEVPTKAITMGIKTIMQAKKIVLCVNGAGKANILKQVLTGPITPKVPGSVLQLHSDVTVVADEEALALVEA